MNNREIEVKYILRDLSLDDVHQQLKDFYKKSLKRSLDTCGTRDFYWKAPKGSQVQIIRLRDSWGFGNDGFSRNLKERTIKVKDQATNLNRLEINEKIEDCESAYQVNSLLFGAPLGHVYKDERVIFTEDGMVISLAQVNQEPFIYLEVEGPTQSQVSEHCETLERLFSMQRENRSLYEIYINKEKA